MASLERLLDQRLAAAFAAVAGSSAEPVLRRSQHADFQADGALALGRRLGRPPRELAAEVVRRTRLDDLCDRVEVAGPGFINLTVAAPALGRLLSEVAGDERLGVPRAASPQTVVVDYSAPNVAKEMHVGHLRSTVIGDAAVRLLEWLGHRVIRANHLGDWGTPFGMLIEHLLDIGEAEAAHELSVGDLDSFYRAARQKFDADEGFRERARRRVVELQRGDPTTRRLWRLLVEESERYFLAVYGRLGVRLTEDDFVGESAYHDRIPQVLQDLERRGLLRESDGARCVFPSGFTNREGEPLPLIVQKADGGFGYAATDLAAIRHRALDLGATRLLYVVGLPQRQHLEMVFAVAREAGWLRPPARAEHVAFGSVLGPDGRMLRSRAGASVKLIDLLDEAVARAGAVVAEKNPSLEPAVREEVAQAVGIGAVKYADLSTDRVKDYVFDYGRMLSFDGNTAPYLQYAHARIRSIFRRGGEGVVEAPGPVTIAEPAERALAIELLGLADVVEGVAESLEFHRLANYLYGLATTFTTFYERLPVLRAEEEVRRSRLALCDLTARTLALGLGLLGIQAPDRM
ncbi:MAG TPA: arginine--tRNA ligase [Candidatus Dormibacteraeota bacterium]|nr:arginine--tRNA ligase [Candidatus Dormibacteraeota bacterium]